MIIHDVEQGSAAWLALRAQHLCASDAPAMMGVSKYTTRNELLKRIATGISEEVEADKQYLFNKGHAAEAAIRPHVEAIIGDELYPCTGSDGELLASFDGATMAEDTIFEHKLYGADLAEQVKRAAVDPHYYWQLEHQLLVSGAKRCIFVTSDGTPERFEHMIYTPVPGRAKALRDGWAQFKSDLAAWKPAEADVIVTAAVVEALPAVSVRMDGAIAVISNLDVFGEKLAAFIANIDKSPSTDQAFADAESACKTLAAAEDALKRAEAAALAQTSSIDDMRRTVELYAEMARTTRLALEKIVKAQKDQIRVEIQQKAAAAFQGHINAINARLGKVQLPAIRSDFAGAMKGKKTLASCRSAVDDELARVKIEANAVGEKIDANLRALAEHPEHAFLFADLQALVMKDAEDLAAVIANRVAAHKAEQQRKEDEARERIRAEEERRAQQDAELKVEQERQRIRAEERELAEREAKQRHDDEVAAWGIADEPKATTPPAAARAIKPTAGAARKPASRPSDADIIGVLAMHYRVHEFKVIEWLLELDLQSESSKLAEAM